jgi:hypothetical protein
MNVLPQQQGSTERGQALVIVAFSMIVLLGIGALVVDLGLSWMLRRQEQNAADPAAIAAARYVEEGDTAATRTKMNTAACFYAQQNGFFEGDASCATAFSDGNLTVNWPPAGPLAGDFVGRAEMVQVIIKSSHPSFFGRVFGQPRAEVRTGAIAARESHSSNSNSLIALDPDSCAAGFVHGNGRVVIEPVENPDTGDPFSGGYVHVNSSCGGGAFNDACSNGSGAFKKAGNAGSLIDAPHIYIHGTCEQAGGTVASPVTEGAPQIGDPLAGLIGPRQEDYPAGYCPRKQGSLIVYDQVQPTSAGCQFNVNNMTATLTPGVYYGGWTFTGNNVTLKLQPGIYIIAGGGVSASGSATISSIGSDPTADPARVLIFSTDNTTDPTCTPALARCVQGAINLSGQSSLKIWGLDSGPFRGLMMWQDGDGTHPDAPLSIVGQGAMNIAGTIYAPAAHVTLLGNGTSTATAAVQIISWTWEIGGNGDLYMPYDPDQLYRITQRGLVH